ncbi:MAG: polysaccharide deacetylase family protein [Kiritimatiellia bacterium]|jgi:peptidoglycan/xylan/chitin deacetylase (PgdA/CDA1 family)
MTTDEHTKVIVSVDVEDWYHGPTMSARWDSRNSLDKLLAANPGIERACSYIDIVLELLERRRVKATFFWVAEYARRFPALFARVAAAGHEIACHGLTHFSKLDYRTKQAVFSPREFKARALTARKILEDMSGRPVRGYRAPNAYVSGAMLDALEETGFTYDSSVSVSSIYNKTDSSLAGVTSAPYYPAPGELRASNQSRSLVEFPWPYYSAAGVKIQSAGGPYLRFFGSGLIIRGLRQSLRRGHAVFYFHPIDLCNESIPMRFSPRRPFLWLFKGDLVKRRVERVLDTFPNRTACFGQIMEEQKNELGLRAMPFYRTATTPDGLSELGQGCSCGSIEPLCFVHRRQGRLRRKII